MAGCQEKRKGLSVMQFRDKLNSEKKAEAKAAQLKVTFLQAITVSNAACINLEEGL